jgi:hypothetical protein
MVDFEKRSLKVLLFIIVKGEESTVVTREPKRKSMAVRNKMAQVYGYVVCVVAIITFLISVSGLIMSLIDKGDPMLSRYQGNQKLVSFEHYKAEALKNVTKDAAYIPQDNSLQEMYEAEKAEYLARAEHSIQKNIIVNIVVIVIALSLFFVHWVYLVRGGRVQTE